jgi:succinate dehydrogenase / fumarate reductase, membrane anchor subunit
VTRKHMQSSFDRTHGLGSAREGVAHWWLQRVTALALIPLTLWFAASLIAHIRGDYSVLILWLRSPFTSVLLVLLLIALFYHMALGLQVVIEDYVHSDRLKLLTVVVTRLASCALAAAGIVTTLRVAFGG